MADVGRGKADVAAEFIMKRIPGCKVTPHMGKIQDKDLEFYKSFNIIIAGLDNIEARRWLNSVVVGLVEFDEDGEPDPSTIIPIVDGGTEGFKGQGRLILPRITACFECTIESFPPQESFPLCTIAETPRLPEHCIAYVYILEWARHFPDRKLDKDNPNDMQWVYQRALERAQKYGIEGVTYFKTIGVIKNIIPAVASTNAVVAAVCVNEAIKILSYCSQSVNNYLMYMGSEGLYTPTFTYDKNELCLVCGDSSVVRKYEVLSTLTLQEFIERLVKDPNLQLQKPSIVAEKTTLYMQQPPSLREKLKGNLSKPLNELISDGELLTITDPAIPDISVPLQVVFVDSH
jgi:ubiquitin-activating enzyme E1 C